MMVVLAGMGCPDGVRAQGQAVAPPQPTAINGGHWPTERVELLDGRQYVGWIESEDNAWVNLVQIQRKAGQPMHLVIRPIERKRVAAVVRLPPAERDLLHRRIEQFINRAPIEAGRMDAVQLAPLQQDGSRFQHYRGKWCALDSTVDEPTTRRIVVRVEQVFTAYRQVLPPRVEPRHTLRLLIFGSPEEYHAHLDRLGLKLDNRACFIQDANLVVAGSEVARFAAEMAKVKGRHDKLRGDLDQLEKQLQQRLSNLGQQLKAQGNPPKEISRLLAIERRKFKDQMDQKQMEVKRCDRENAKLFDKVTRLMFTRLHHETFHAYLENYVYPHENYHVPLWLNEGLAVLFEGGLLESDTLRIDAPNADALKRLKADLSSQQPLALAKLLAAEPAAFALPQANASAAADRYYLYAWGLVYYLTFEKHLLGSPGLNDYVQKSAAAALPTERFEKLAGAPLPQFEQQWRQYILALR